MQANNWKAFKVGHISKTLISKICNQSFNFEFIVKSKLSHVQQFLFLKQQSMHEMCKTTKLLSAFNMQLKFKWNQINLD